MDSKALKLLVKKIKTKHKKGFLDSEIHDLITKQNIDKIKFFEILGVNTCLIINGELITYKHDVLNALNKYYGLGGSFD